MKNFKRLPRKLKKGLKKAILFPIDPDWRSNDVKITSIKRIFYFRLKNAFERPKYKAFAVTGYTLGI